MGSGEIDLGAFAFLMLRWFVILFLLYIISLFLLRFSSYYKIRRCPNCSGDLKRAQRSAGDKFVKSVSFGILPVKRYRCYTCYWEGRAFDIPNKQKSKSLADESDNA